MALTVIIVLAMVGFALAMQVIIWGLQLFLYVSQFLGDVWYVLTGDYPNDK